MIQPGSLAVLIDFVLIKQKECMSLSFIDYSVLPLDYSLNFISIVKTSNLHYETFSQNALAESWKNISIFCRLREV